MVITPALVNLITAVGSLVLGVVLRHYGIVLGSAKPAAPAPAPAPAAPSTGHPLLDLLRTHQGLVEVVTEAQQILAQVVAPALPAAPAPAPKAAS